MWVECGVKLTFPTQVKDSPLQRTNELPGWGCLASASGHEAERPVGKGLRMHLIGLNRARNAEVNS